MIKVIYYQETILCQQTCSCFSKMDKAILQVLVDKGFSTRQISKTCNTSQTNTRYWLLKHNLSTNHSGKVYRCGYCGENNPSNFYQKRKFACKYCRNKQRALLNKSNKILCVEYKGGKCSCCGYNKCLGALEFHHVDPLTKDPNFNLNKNRSIERQKTEIDKCILLCSNCHRELHESINKSGRSSV